LNGGRSELQILMVTNVFAPLVGGTGAVAQAIAENLPRNVSIFTPRIRDGYAKKGEETAFDRQFGFRVFRGPELVRRVPLNIPRQLRAILHFGFNILVTQPAVLSSVRGVLRKNPVQVLCLNDLTASYWLARPLKRKYPGLQVVFYLHGEEVNDGPKRLRTDLLAQKCMREADAVVVVSSFTRGRALKCGVAPEKITVIHNGVDTGRFSPGPKNAEIEARFGLKGKLVILCLARLDERKGQDKLLEAMPEILRSVPEAVLLLVGGGDDEARLRGIAADHGLEGKAIFAGPATESEVVGYYRTADIYAMPNRPTAGGDTEGFGLVFLEAGACEKPVIGGRAGGVVDAIIDGETGYLVDGTSRAAVAGACIRVLEDPALRARLGQNGLAHAQRNTWAAKAGEFLRLCEGLRTTGRGGSS